MSSVNGKSWTARARERAVGALPPDKLLPDSQPSYMASWILRVRRANARRARSDHRVGLDLEP